MSGGYRGFLWEPNDHAGYSDEELWGDPVENVKRLRAEIERVTMTEGMSLALVRLERSLGVKQ